MFSRQSNKLQGGPIPLQIAVTNLQLATLFPCNRTCNLKLFINMNLTLFVVVLITAILLVVIAMSIARAISPRTFNKQKGEAYECGVPTRGKSWMQFKAGYYLFAILFLMFDVETVFLYPWAVTVQDAGINGLLNVLFFMLILILGLAYAWKKGALEWK